MVLNKLSDTYDLDNYLTITISQLQKRIVSVIWQVAHESISQVFSRQKLYM